MSSIEEAGFTFAPEEDSLSSEGVSKLQKEGSFWFCSLDDFENNDLGYDKCVSATTTLIKEQQSLREELNTKGEENKLLSSSVQSSVVGLGVGLPVTAGVSAVGGYFSLPIVKKFLTLLRLGN